jgi:hypothetical protein
MSRNLKTIFSFIFFALNAAFAFGNTIRISSFSEMKKEFEKADNKTLIIFDVDEVLITTQDHFMHPYADAIFLPMIHRAFSQATTPNEKKEVEENLSLCMLLPKRVLIEEETPRLIKDLQKRHIKVIALTSCPTGRFGVIPQVERWRIEHLNAMNISFASSFPDRKRESFAEMASEGKPAPLFEEGILFSKGYKKGQVLKEFIRRCKFHPAKVVFIDDLEENLASVQAEMQAMSIAFQGYQYTGAERFFKEADEKVLKLQFEHLMEKKEWLSDAEVKLLLADSNDHK